MKRPTGLVASIIVLSLASLMQIISALGMLLVAELRKTRALPVNPAAPPQPPWMSTAFVGMAIIFLGLAIWGIATTVGIHRLRRWARYSILVIAGCMAVLGAFGLLIMLGAMMIPLHTNGAMGSTRAESAQVFAHVFLAILGMLYAVPLGIGIWWLIYFNRSSVGALFAGPTGEFEESRRPFLISIYSVLCVFGAACVLLVPFMPIPGVLLTFILHGWAKGIFYSVFALLQLAAGIGLWRLKEWARRLALALLAFGAVQMCIYVFRPSILLQISAETNRAMSLPARPPISMPLVIQTVIFATELAFFVTIAFMLHYYRGRFNPAAIPATSDAA